jgi:hypothetical protein
VVLLAVYIGLPVLAVVVLGYTLARTWRGYRTTRVALGELRAHLSSLSAETATLSTRLDAATAASRFGDRDAGDG